MKYLHELLEKDISIIDVPNFSIIIAFYVRPGILEQCLLSAQRHAFNKNHEYICVADHDDHLINPYYPTLKLAKTIDESAYFLKKENFETMNIKIREESISIKKCMNDYSDIKWISLFEYLRGEKKIEGFNYNLDFPTNGNPGRGNFYLSYNLGARLAKNDFIMMMVNDDVIFTPNWDLKMWQAFHNKDKEIYTCVPYFYCAFNDDLHPTTYDILNGPGIVRGEHYACAEPWYKVENNNWCKENNYIFEDDFIKFTEKVQLKNKYLIEAQNDRHYGYFNFNLMKKDLFFRFNGYDMVGFPKVSQDISFDDRLGRNGIKKVVVLDSIVLHMQKQCLLYINKDTKYLIGK